MKYSVSILCHNNLSLTKRCVDSVLAAGGDFELILTDNGSSDGTCAYINEIAMGNERIAAVYCSHNGGFIRGNLDALSIAEGDFLVLLNNDTVVPSYWLDALESPFLYDPLCAISGATGCCLDEEFIGHHSNNVEYIEGSCLMIRTEFARKIGLFDTNLIGAYCEDADLSLRVRQKGYSIHTVPLEMSHLGGATSAMVPQAPTWLKQNTEYMKNKWATYLKTRSFSS